MGSEAQNGYLSLQCGVGALLNNMKQNMSVMMNEVGSSVASLTVPNFSVCLRPVALIHRPKRTATPRLPSFRIFKIHHKRSWRKEQGRTHPLVEPLARDIGTIHVSGP
jgi:hypothetical protein